MQLLCKLCSGFLSCAVCSWIFHISVQLYFKIPIAVKKCSNYPPSNSPNFTDYAPFQIARKKCSNYPPRIHRTLPTTPPSKYSPVEFTGLCAVGKNPHNNPWRVVVVVVVVVVELCVVFSCCLPMHQCHMAYALYHSCTVVQQLAKFGLGKIWFRGRRYIYPTYLLGSSLF